MRRGLRFHLWLFAALATARAALLTTVSSPQPGKVALDVKATMAFKSKALQNARTVGGRLGKQTQERPRKAWMNTLGALFIAMPIQVPRAVARGVTRVWRLLPGKLPRFWRASGLTTDSGGKVLFMLSNVAYLYAGLDLLMRAPPLFGSLTLAVCAASCAYHAAQCLHGCDSEASARTCTVDTALAAFTSLAFLFGGASIDAISGSLALLSLALFKDQFNIGYTTSHSLWHVSTAAAAIWSGGSLARAHRLRSKAQWD